MGNILKEDSYTGKDKDEEISNLKDVIDELKFTVEFLRVSIVNYIDLLKDTNKENDELKIKIANLELGTN